MNIFHEDHESWLTQVHETAIDPEIPIIDPHHHLWPEMLGQRYEIEEYTRDLTSGHNVVGSVFMECSSQYRADGPESERSLGETEYVMAQRDKADSRGPQLLGMVGHIDLSLGESVSGLLDKHQEIAGDFFKGVRHALASSEPGVELMIPGPSPRGLSQSSEFREGVACLGRRGLVYESWHYHYQIRDFAALASACPDTVLVLDHFGTPLGVPPYNTDTELLFENWKADIEYLSQFDNVLMKLGGLAMPDNGYPWHTDSKPPTSDQVVAAQRDWYLHAIDCFGPARCMFESNFPVDRLSLSYCVLYNAFKKMVSDFSYEERLAMFHDNADSVYSLGA